MLYVCTYSEIQSVDPFNRHLLKHDLNLKEPHQCSMLKQLKQKEKNIDIFYDTSLAGYRNHMPLLNDVDALHMNI